MFQNRTFLGYPLDFVQGFPITTAAPLSQGGIYLGRRFDGQPFYLHPWQQHNEGGMLATTILVTAQIGYRKSTLRKVFSLRALAMQAGSIDGAAQKMRLRSHGRKHEKGRCENAPMMEKIKGHNIVLSEANYNPFYGASAWHLVEKAIIMTRHSLKRELHPDEVYAIQLGVFRMTQHDPRLHGLKLFISLTIGVEQNDVIAYENKLAAELRSDYEAKFSSNTQLLQGIEVVMAPGDTKSHSSASLLMIDDIRRAAYTVGSALRRIADPGDYGQAFNGLGDNSEMYEGRAQNWDWFTLTPSAISLHQILQEYDQIIDEVNGRYDRIPHMNMSDEGHAALGNPDYAIGRARRLAVVRRNKTLEWETTQYVRQISGIGDSGSAHRNAGASIMQTIGLRIWGRVERTDVEGTDELRSVGFSPEDIEQVHRLKPGQFAAKPTTARSPIFFNLQVTDLEWPLIQTSSAVQEMTDTVPVADQHPHLTIS